MRHILFCTGAGGGGGGGGGSGGDALMSRNRKENHAIVETSNIGEAQTWTQVKCEESNRYYWWCEETDEVTSVGAARPRAWREIKTDEGSYFWCEETDETTPIGAVRPRYNDSLPVVGKDSSSVGGGIGSMVVAGAGIGLGFGVVGLILSDRRLKSGIVRFGSSPSGIPIYRYKYTFDPSGAIFEGAMAQDLCTLCPDAVHRTQGGIMSVNYGVLDVSFRRVG